MDELINDEKKELKEEHWKTHILAAKDFLGSDHEYCRRNGLHPTTFSGYKRKLGFMPSKKKMTRKFVKVLSEPAEKNQKEPLQVSYTKLPDPKWTAELLLALAKRQ